MDFQQNQNKFYEKTLSSKKVYEGKVFEVLKDEIELFDGEKTLIRGRDVVVHPGGVVIVAQKADGKILLVKQYRYPIKIVEYELPAGRLEKGEDPLLAAKRELLEETGYSAQNWESLGFIYTTPGICTEKLYLFKANHLTFIEQQPDEGEIIDYFEIEHSDVNQMIKKGEINDAKTLCGLMRAFGLEDKV